MNRPKSEQSFLFSILFHISIVFFKNVIRNNFNFLKFKQSLDDPIDLEPDIEGDKFVVDSNSKIISKSNDIEPMQSDFPYLTTFAIACILAFFVYKFVKQRKRIGLKKFERFNR